MQTKVEDEAEGISLVSGYLSLVVDILADIVDHVLPLSLRRPVRIIVIPPDLTSHQSYLFAVVAAVDMEDIFPPSRCFQMVFGSTKSRP